MIHTWSNLLYQYLVVNLSKLWFAQFELQLKVALKTDYVLHNYHT